MKQYRLGERQVKLGNKLAWGVGDFGAGYVDTAVATFFLFFLTTVVGLSPARAGTIIAVSKIWDAISDPLMGYISDRTISKFGRRGVYILFGAVPSGIIFFLMFFKVAYSSEAMTFAYYMFIYLLQSTIWTICNVPYNTIAAEMTSDYGVRAKMTGMRAPFSRTAAFIVSFATPLLIYGMSTLEQGFMTMGIISGVGYAVCWLLVYLGTWNRRLENEEIERYKKEKFSFKTVYGEFFSVFSNRHMRQNLMFMVFFYLTIYVFSAFNMYFVTLYLEQTANASILASAAALGCAISAFFWGNIIAMPRVGNGRACVFGGLIWGLGISAATFCSPGGNYIIPFIPLFIAGLGMCVIMLAPYNLLPFSADADYIITTKHREGVYTGMMVFLQKIAVALVTFVLGYVLSGVGYVSGSETQTPEAINGIMQVMRYAPLLCAIPGVIGAARYKVNAGYHAKVRSAIAKLESGTKPTDLPEEEAVIIEDFTGWKREKLWNPENLDVSKKQAASKS